MDYLTAEDFDTRLDGELSTKSILALFETTKEQRASFANDVINRLENGDIDPLKVHLQVKGMEDIIKVLTGDKKYKDAILTAAQHYGGKTFDYKHSKFEIKETGVKYDYANCNDQVLNELLAQQTELDAKVKARQKLLQTAPEKGLTVLDEATGEAFTVYPPAKSSTTSVAVTLK